jgi:SAM-dependent methyltransferase
VFAEEARKRSGCPVFVGPIERAEFPPGTFDIINAHFVLEYVPTLRATFAELARLLADGGVLRVCGYTTDSLAARLRGSRWWNYTPTRLFLFSRKTVEWLATENGLRLAEVIHGGEQSQAKYLAERPEGARTRRRVAMDRLRYRLERVVVAGQSLSSCRAFYLTRR